MKAWKQALREDDTANVVAAPAAAGTKRKAVSGRPVPSRSPRADRAPGRVLPDRGTCAAQDVSVDEAEIRSKYEAGALAKVRPRAQCSFFPARAFCCARASHRHIAAFGGSAPGMPVTFETSC